VFYYFLFVLGLDAGVAGSHLYLLRLLSNLYCLLHIIFLLRTFYAVLLSTHLHAYRLFCIYRGVLNLLEVSLPTDPNLRAFTKFHISIRRRCEARNRSRMI
jgi:hypothetical protein